MDHAGDVPFVSIIVPCRDESRYIAQCIESIVTTDYPVDRLEVLIIDGMSEDGTRRIAASYSEKFSFVEVLDNPRQTVPYALNLGISVSRGEVIMRMDVHAFYPQQYVSDCVHLLLKSGADNVGGRFETLSSADTLIARSISLAMAHPFGVGNAAFRTGSTTVRRVDTVPFGCFQREVFDRIGLFDEELTRNQDDELNHRLLKNGGLILLAPEIVIHYYARETLPKLLRMYYQYGYFKPLAVRKLRHIPTVRQLVPPAFVAGLAIGLGSMFFTQVLFVPFGVVVAIYLSASASISFLAAARKDALCSLVLPLCFAAMHLGYGLGYLHGVFDCLVFDKGRPSQWRG